MRLHVRLPMRLLSILYKPVARGVATRYASLDASHPVMVAASPPPAPIGIALERPIASRLEQRLPRGVTTVLISSNAYPLAGRRCIRVAPRLLIPITARLCCIVTTHLCRSEYACLASSVFFIVLRHLRKRIATRISMRLNRRISRHIKLALTSGVTSPMSRRLAGRVTPRTDVLLRGRLFTPFPSGAYSPLACIMFAATTTPAPRRLYSRLPPRDASRLLQPVTCREPALHISCLSSALTTGSASRLSRVLAAPHGSRFGDLFTRPFERSLATHSRCRDPSRHLRVASPPQSEHILPA
jgi:hypothetical protein